MDPVPGLAAAALGLAALALGALPAAWRLRMRQPRLDLLAWGFLTLHLLTALVLVAGGLGALRPAPLLGAALAAGAAGGAWLARRPGVRCALAAGAARRWGAARRRPVLLTLLVAVIVVQAVREALHVLLLPPYVWDTLTYHLPRLPEWIQAGALRSFETPSLRTHWPANHELLQLWLALFPRHDALVDAAGIPFHGLAAGAVYASARSLGARRAIAAFAAVAYGCCPAVALQATSGKNDLPVAAAFLFSVAVLLDLRARRVRSIRHLVWLALVLALTVGTKPYIAFLLPGLLVVGWTCVRPALPRVRPVVAAARRAIRLAPATAGLAAASLLLVAGAWYARNAAEFGDPFYPTNLQLFGELVFDGERGRAQQNTASLDGLARNLRMTFRRKVLDDRGPFTAELQDIAGWGWFTFGFGLPALALALWREPLLRWLAGGFALSLVALFLWVAPDPWNLRFTLWFPAVAALAFASALTRLRPSALRTAWGALAGLAVGLDLAGSVAGSHQDPAVWRAMAARPLAERSTAALGTVVPYIGPGFAHALATVPRGAPIGYHTHKDGGIYPLYDADYSRRVVFVPIAVDDDVADVMRARGVDYLYVTHARAVVHEMLDRAVAARRLRRLGPELYVVGPA